MDLIQRQIAKLKLMRSSIENIAISELKQEGDVMAKLNVDQLKQGIDATGKPTPLYAKSNKKKSGNITFIDKGGFTSGIKAVFGTKSVGVISTDKKVDFLNPWKGKTPTLGLIKSNRAKVAISIIPNILRRLKNI